jgi:predicted nucleic acid-binding protein
MTQKTEQNKTQNNAIYWDSSALIKRYVTEEHSDSVRSNFKKSSLHFTSTISHAEVLASFSRLKREGYISQDELQKISLSFLADWNNLYVVQYSDGPQAIAQTISSNVSARGMDLIHLTSALHLQNEGLEIEFISFDIRLNNAAKDLKLTTL